MSKKKFCLVGCFLAVGCISPTESQRRNAGAITDVAKKFHKEGTPPNTPLTEQHQKNAGTNEAIIGSPKERIAPTDIKTQEENRVQAEKDAEAGGFWWITGASTLGLLGTLATVLGLKGVGSWLSQRSNDMVKLQIQVKTAEATAERYTGHFNTVTGAIGKYLGPVAPEDHLLKEALRGKARDAGNKVDFDRAVKESRS